MPKPKNPETFDVAGNRYIQHEDCLSLLKQAFADYRTPDPSRNFTQRIQGNQVTIYCHCHERGLGDPGRRALQVDAMSSLTDQYVKGLKKRYKELGGGTLKFDEIKSARGYDLQKASLNDRWEIIYRRTYEFEDLIKYPEED